jgi:hypothetical protein
MATIATNRGILSDNEFEYLAQRELRSLSTTLPAPRQLDLVLNRYGVDPHHADWARSVALRALTKLLVAGGTPTAEQRL